MSRETENSVLLLSFIVYFLKYMKDEVKIYDQLDKNVIKNLPFLLFLLKLTILKNELLFYIINNIKHLLFSTIYICPHFFYENLLFYIANMLLTFIKLQKLLFSTIYNIFYYFWNSLSILYGEIYLLIVTILQKVTLFGFSNHERTINSVSYTIVCATVH